MKKVSILIITILTCIAVFTTAIAGLKKPKTQDKCLRKIIERMQHRFDKVHAFQADFVQKSYSGAVQMTTIGKGKLYLQKPKMMRWDYTDPEPQSFVTDGIKTWLYIPSEKKILIDDAKKFFNSPMVKSFLDGPQNFTKYFEVIVGNKPDSQDIVLVLIPKARDSNVDVEQITLWVSRNDYQIKTIETKDYLGNRNKVTLVNIKVLPKLPRSLFTLTVPSGVTVETKVSGSP